MLDLEIAFSVVSLLAMAGWISLIFSPFIPLWSERISGLILPLLLSGGYIALILFFPSSEEGGFGSLAEVLALFTHEVSVLAAWVHFLSFDLLIGAWICRTARREEIRFWLVLPCLPLTFMFGPAGFLVFNVLRFAVTNRTTKITGVVG